MILSSRVSARGSQAQTIDVRVSASSDDAEERTNRKITTKSSDLEMSFDVTDQIVGLRFADLPIPSQSQILSATVQFQADESSSGATSLEIHGQGDRRRPYVHHDQR